MTGRASAPRRTKPRSTTQKPLADYSELLRRVKDAGLLERSPLFSLTLLVVLTVLLALTLTATELLQNSWCQLAAAAVLGVVMAQFGFIAHEASHREVFETGPANDLFGRVVGCLLVGISYSWWKGGHNRHHAQPNVIGRDPSIAAGALVHTADDAGATRGVARWYYRHQGGFVFALLPLAALNLHVQSVRALLSRTPPERRGAELSMILVRHGLLALVIFTAMPVGMAVGYIAVHLAVFGVCVASAFIPNHVGMPLIPADASIDYLHRQVTTSRNIRGGALASAWMGGLNFQIEHHLFPSMPRPNLPAARLIVRDYCQERGIAYTEVTATEAWRQVVRFLDEVGVSAGLRQTKCPTADVLGR